MSRLTTMRTACSALLLLGICSTALAQTYPVKPVRLIIPFPAGAAADTVGRTFASKFAEIWGQQVIADNRGGANTIVGSEIAAKSAPDGYTLFLTSATTQVTNPLLYRKLPYDARKSFQPIALTAEVPFAVVTHPSLPVNSVKELVAYARAHPGELAYASSGSGSSGHLSLEMFKALTGVQMQNVFYKGAALSKIDLAAGRVQVAIDNIPGYLSELTSGTVRMLAVGTKSRLPGWPDIPTLDEAGVKGYESSVWYAMAAPRATAANIVRRINEVAGNALRTPQMQERFKQLHGIPMGGTPEDANRYFAEETQRWRTIIAAAGIKPE